MNARKEKLKAKKNKKKGLIEERTRTSSDQVHFGEVVQAPPTLSHKPKGKKTTLEKPKKDIQDLAARRAHEMERQRAIDAYRQKKKQKQVSLPLFEKPEIDMDDFAMDDE